MQCICPECKNQVDLTPYGEIKPDIVIECNHCGITLLVKHITPGEPITTEIIEEGK